MSGITFDAGGLIALDRNDRRALTLVARAMELGFGSQYQRLIGLR